MYKIGIDTGGTYTDGVLFDEHGDVRLFKAPTTPADFSIGVIDCLANAASGLGLELRQFLDKVGLIAHGTTITTNACIVSGGAKVGTISTKGFRDILEMRRGVRPASYYETTEPAPVLVPRHRRYEVEERVVHSGEVLTPLNEDEVREAIRQCKRQDVEAIAVSLLFSFVNPAHEQRIRELIQETCPDMFVSISSETLPQIREFERTSTTVLDAYVGPSLTRYLTRLEQRLEQEGFRGELLLMQSNGGVRKVAAAMRRPVSSINSGPAAALPAGLYFADVLDCPDILSVDMGGTSFDVAMMKDRSIVTTTDGWIGHHRNATPMVDILAIGAGGGSIAWIDANNILQVGPDSAGALPGPAAYGIGGTRATVTDANLILGYLNPDHLLGRGAFDVAAAQAALGAIGERLGIGVVETATAIHDVVNENMVNAVILAATRRGYDPQDFVLVVGGGTGPTHAVSLARKLDIGRIVVPRQSPVYCAFGLLLSDLKHDYVCSHVAPLRTAQLEEVNRLLARMEQEGRIVLRQEKVAAGNIVVERSATMRYVGQFKEIEIGLPEAPLSRQSVPLIEEAFSRQHESLFTFSDPSRPIELVTLKVMVSGRLPNPPLRSRPLRAANPDHALKGTRAVRFPDPGDYVPSRVYDGALLDPGNVVEGPAVIEEFATALVVPPRCRFRMDEFGNYLSWI